METDPRHPVPAHLDASSAIEPRRPRVCLDGDYMAVIAHTPVPGSALDLADRDIEWVLA